MKTGQSEDCLFANVWAPANATTQSKLPVWVFIQGGGMSWAPISPLEFSRPSFHRSEMKLTPGVCHRLCRAHKCQLERLRGRRAVWA